MQFPLQFKLHATSATGNDILASARQFIQGRTFNSDKLYFLSTTEQPAAYQHIHFFSIDSSLVYINFFADFGPSNLAHVVRFCQLLQEKFHVSQITRILQLQTKRFACIQTCSPTSERMLRS
jgi:hypothetical protein